MSLIHELLCVVGKRHELDVKNQNLKAEVKEIRAALGDDGRRTHKEILEMATKASDWRTWKKKYIDLKNAHIAEGQDPAGTIWEHADKLQEELKVSEAEVERLSNLIEDCLNVIRVYCPTFYNDAMDRFNKITVLRPKTLKS